jgi:hypothetical protein
MAMTDAEGYQRATALVGAVVTELRQGSTSVSDVLRMREELMDRLPALAQVAALNLGALPPDAIVDAASAVRCRELQAADTAAAWQGRIAAAHAAGEEWLATEPDPAEVMSGTYRRSELHLATGTTVITTIEAGSATTGATYSLEVLRPGGEGQASSAQVYRNREAWASAVDEIREALAGDV